MFVVLHSHTGYYKSKCTMINVDDWSLKTIEKKETKKKIKDEIAWWTKNYTEIKSKF